jgi:hypothetical protein
VSYDFSASYGPSDPLLTLDGTTVNHTSFTVTKELNITIRVTAFDGFATSQPFFGTYEVRKPPPPPPLNHRPGLTNGTVNPAEGNEQTVFEFSVRYFDRDGDSPNVSLIVDGSPMSMHFIGGDNSTGAAFRLSLRLAAGDHVYRFRADDRRGTANSTNETAEFHLTVVTSGGVPVALVAGMSIAVVAAVVVAVFLVWRSRRLAQAAAEKPVEEKTSEESETGKEGGV